MRILRRRAPAALAALVLPTVLSIVLPTVLSGAPPVVPDSAEVPAATPPGKAGAGLWLPPLGRPLRVSAAYALPNGLYNAGHRGIDLTAASGAIVRSPATGIVSFIGTVVDRPVVSIRVDAHTVLSLEPVSSELHAGDAVARGAELGAVDAGGHCAAACLHIGARVDGAYVNPLRFLRARPVLLPW